MYIKVRIIRLNEKLIGVYVKLGNYLHGSFRKLLFYQPFA